MATSPAPTLTCAQCGYTNEAERVYCHNCGTKLDRSLLPKEAQKKPESADAARARVRRMTNPGGSQLVQDVKTGLNVIFYAAVVAALILIALPPQDVPGKSAIGDRMVGSDLAEALEAAQPRQLVFTENDVNAHLRSVKNKTGGWIPGIDFQRAFVQFEPGVVRIGIEQSVFNYSVYTTINEQIGVGADGKLWSKQTGGHFGRLGLHPLLMEYGSVAFSKLWTALKRENDQMNRMQAVTVEKGRIVLITKPAGKP